MEEKDLYEYLNSLIVWAEGRGYYIHFEEGGDNCICPDSKIIEINSSSPLEDQVYCLLHECGHVAIYENGSFWDFQNKPRYLYSRNPSEHEDFLVKERYRVYTVIEEAEAWQRGFKLANRLNIPISKERWEQEMLIALGKYLDWAAT